MKNQKLKIKNQKYKLKIFVLGLVFLLFPFFSFCAVLYLEPSEGEYGLGEHFGIKIRLDPEKECINALNIGLVFPSEILRVEDVNLGDSIINLWVKRPKTEEVTEFNQKGEIWFSGGIPGGYCGIIPGDPGKSNVLAEIRFFLPSFLVGEISQEDLEIKFSENSEVFLNDGLGTKANISFQSAKIKISKTKPATENEWKKIIGEDKNPPEIFEIEVRQDPNIFEGKYYLVFQTTDKETGVDHYEIAEIPPGKDLPSWKKGESPYLLEDQKLESRILVKAIDKAGNSRVVELAAKNLPSPIVPEKKLSFFEKVIFNLKKFSKEIAITCVVLLIILGLIIYLLKKRKKSHKIS